MQPFTVESVNESLELFGIAPASVKHSVDALETGAEAAQFLSTAASEAPCGAVVDLSQTLQEGLDALQEPCSRSGVGLAYRVDDETGNAVVDVSISGSTKLITPTHRPREADFHPVAHAIEKAADGHIRIFPIRSTYNTDTVTYVVLAKHDWERLLRVLGNSAFNALFVALDGKPVV